MASDLEKRLAELKAAEQKIKDEVAAIQKQVVEEASAVLASRRQSLAAKAAHGILDAMKGISIEEALKVGLLGVQVIVKQTETGPMWDIVPVAKAAVAAKQTGTRATGSSERADAFPVKPTFMANHPNPSTELQQWAVEARQKFAAGASSDDGGEKAVVQKTQYRKMVAWLEEQGLKPKKAKKEKAA